MRKKSLGITEETPGFRSFAFLITGLMVVLALGELPADWPSQRGNPQSTGVAQQPLGKELKEIWRAKLPDAVESTPAIYGGKVFLGDFSGKFACWNLADGKSIWQVEIAAARAAPAVSGDRVIVGDLDGIVHALKVTDGEHIWQKDIKGEIDSGATIVDGKVYIASQAGELVCLSLNDGEMQWTYETMDQIRSSPTVADGRIFLAGCDGRLHQVGLADGKSAGKPLDLDGPTGSTPTVLGSTVLVPTFGGIVLGLDWRQEKRLWEYADSDRDQEYRSSPAATEQVAVVCSQGKLVTAIDVNSGKELWKKTLRRRADASPVIAGNSVFVAATDGVLWRFDLQTGEEQWQYEMRGSFLASPAISDGKLVVATDQGDILCFE